MSVAMTIRNGRDEPMGPYGCHNKPRPKPGSFVHHSKHRPPTAIHKWPFVNSTDCQYDRSHDDSRCAGCQHGKPANG